MKKIIMSIVLSMVSFGAFAEESGRLHCVNGDYESQVVFEYNWSVGTIIDNQGGEYKLRNIEWKDNVAHADLTIQGSNGKPKTLNYEISGTEIRTYYKGDFVGSAKCSMVGQETQSSEINLKGGNGTDMWIYPDHNQVWVTSNSKYFKKQFRFLSEGQNLKIAVKYTNKVGKYGRGDFDWVKPAQIEARTVNGVNYIVVTDPQVSELDLDVANNMIIATKAGFNYWWQSINLNQ